MTTKTTITDFELVDLGIEYPDYFQGFGCSFTRFEHCAYGIGANPAEAIDDLLEQVASMGFDVDGLDSRLLADADLQAWPETPQVEDDESYYHIGLRWNA
jgi:hypothetical protein